MRIGVLTYHCVPNFGAQLQAMSTVGYLKRMGHTPVILHWYPKDLETLYARRVSKKQIICQMRFAEDNLPLSSLCRNEKQLIREIDLLQLDMIVTGSDALFRYVPLCDRRREFSKRRLRYINNYVSSETIEGNPFFCDYYGELARQIPIVAFSVSSQSCPFYKMIEREREEMGRYLRNFARISVRDQWTKQMVESISGLKNILITPDPVFAFNPNCYIHIPNKEDVCSRFSLPANYALLSFSKGAVSNGFLHVLGDALLQKGITPITLAEPEGFGPVVFPHKIDLPLSPIDWYALIKHANAYIGTRMHPIIVCLHNCIPFFSFDGNGTIDAITGEYNQKSSKIFDILEKAGFENNIYAFKSGEEIPQGTSIIEKIISFDNNRCNTFSMNKTIDYERGMKYIMSL